MDKNEFNFSSDCVINFDDLGQCKDYTDMVADLETKLIKLKHNKQSTIPNELWQVIQADPEDTFHCPKFQSVIQLLVGNQYIYKTCSQEHLHHIIILYFHVLQEYFLSFTFKEQIGENIIATFQSLQFKFMFFQQTLLKFLFRMSAKFIFIENVQKIIQLWTCFDEKLFFGGIVKEKEQDQVKYIYMAMYIESCEKMLRNKYFRKIVLNKLQKFNVNFLMLKLSIWQKQKQKFFQLKQKFSLVEYYNNSYLKQMIAALQQKQLQK